ncbi:MAG: HD domain-containing protein [Sulfurovum sp.]|nr:HD domain-containing protein [Sulfurovum sp.]MDD3603418.1 HD domain-containing protein [Sulfurovum sp.]
MNSLKAEIEDLIYANAADFQIAKVLKKEIRAYVDTLKETFMTSGGKDFLVKHTKKIDMILKIVYKVAQREMFGDYIPMKNTLPLSLIALGSYGREQLCVHSDIDLMIVYKDIPGYNLKEMIEKILYILWDTGLKLSHRVHTVEELYAVSKTDITIKTALIESRFIEGSAFIWTETQNAIRQIRHDTPHHFIQLKLEEQKYKHEKFPLTMEPNLKEGIGGFRDANLVFWIGKILYDVNSIKNLPSSIVDENDYKEFRIALEFLFRVRSALHLVAHKKEDTLRLDLIADTAHLLGYKMNKNEHMKFAKKVIESLQTIRLYSIIWTESLCRGYMIDTDIYGHCIYPQGEKRQLPVLLRQLCDQKEKAFDAHPTFLAQLIKANKPVRHSKSMLLAIKHLFFQPYSYNTFKILSTAKLLSYVIPPLKKVIALPQFDGYHQFTVEIHSLECLYHLENIQDTFIENLFHTLHAEEKALLKLAMLLHDAGKGRKRDHHHVGASLFKPFAKKLDFSPELIEMGETLILHHTLMSKVAQREDLHNEKVILKFVSYFKTKTLLDMMYILTYADMNGVGKGIYNSFNAKLIKMLYLQSLKALKHTEIIDETAKRIKKEQTLKKHPLFLSLSKSQQNKILMIPSNLLFLRYSPQKIISISKKAFKTDSYTYEIYNEDHLTLEIVCAHHFNLSYLLSKLAYLDVANMDICKLFDGYKYFKIDFAFKINENEITRIDEMIRDALYGQKQNTLLIPVIKKNEIQIDCSHSQMYGSMYLHCKNQKGLLAYVLDLFDTLHIEIATAKVHSLKNTVRDMFLIEKNGNFCHNIDIIIEKLTKKE